MQLTFAEPPLPSPLMARLIFSSFFANFLAVASHCARATVFSVIIVCFAFRYDHLSDFISQTAPETTELESCVIECGRALSPIPFFRSRQFYLTRVKTQPLLTAAAAMGDNLGAPALEATIGDNLCI